MSRPGVAESRSCGGTGGRRTMRFVHTQRDQRRTSPAARSASKLGSPRRRGEPRNPTSAGKPAAPIFAPAGRTTRRAQQARCPHKAQQRDGDREDARQDAQEERRPEDLSEVLPRLENPFSALSRTNSRCTKPRRAAPGALVARRTGKNEGGQHPRDARPQRAVHHRRSTRRLGQ